MTKLTIYMDAQDLPAHPRRDHEGRSRHIYRGDLNKDGADVSELEGAAHTETPALLRI